MNALNREQLRENVVKFINEQPFDNFDFNWVEITDGFDIKAMTYIVFNIEDDTVLDRVIDCIEKAWDIAYNYNDSIIYNDSGSPKFDGTVSFIYELNKIRKSRNTLRALKQFHDNETSTPSASPFTISEHDLQIEETNDVLEKQLQQQSTVDNQNEIDKLRAEIESLNGEIEYLKNETGKLTAKEAAILTITACYYGGGWKSRENLQPLLTNLFGVPEVHAKRRLREGIKKGEPLETLAKCFEDVSPKIARLLREMPETLINYKKKKSHM